MHSTFHADVYFIFGFISPAELKKKLEMPITTYMDMSKAFDKVDHTLLLNKLRTNFLISGNLLSWFRSYLLSRRQRVTLLGTSPPEMDVTSGVPQSSILGPILFLLYVSDLPDVVVNSKVASFANDTKLYRRRKT